MAFELIGNEKVLIMRRRHWFRLLTEMAPLLLLIASIGAAPWAIGIFLPGLFLEFGTEIFFALGLFLQVVLLSTFVFVADYYLDIWVVTDKRLVFIELHGLFSRNISSVDFSKIQDVSIEVHGVLPTLLHFGNLQIQTAGAFRPFIFKDVPYPAELKERILALKEESHA